MRGTLLERTVAKVVFGHPLECWPFIGHLDRDGYGQIRTGTRQQGTSRPHRVVYEAMVGAIPDGLELDHLCEVKSCCNPYHLEPTSHGENMRRWMARARRVGATWERR